MFSLVTDRLLPALVLASVVPFAAPFAQTTWYVDDDACPAVGSGTPSDPFCSIAAALAASSSGDAIRVAPGDYGERIDFGGKSVHLLAVGGPEVTRISGAGYGRQPIVTFASGETHEAAIEGFTIGSKYLACCSWQGVLCSGASPTIRNNVIENNIVDLVGGGVCLINGSAALLVGNHIRNNGSTAGVGTGGGVCSTGPAWIYGNVIEDNEAWSDPGGFGGGIYVSGPAVIENNLIAGNTVCDQEYGRGGGIFVGSSPDGPPTILGNTIVGNDACGSGLGGGGGVCAWQSLTIQDSILWGNVARRGSEIYVASSSARVELVNCDVSGVDDWIGGPGTAVVHPGNLRLDPQFVGGGDYHLTPNSPLIDAGTPGRIALGTDGDREPRVLDGLLNGTARVDIGWDEYDPTTLGVSGTPSPGQVLTFRIGAPPGWSYVIAFARGVADLPRPPYGSLLIDPETSRQIGSGNAPGVARLALPPQHELLGLTLHVQALGFDPASPVGSFSRRVDLRIR